MGALKRRSGNLFLSEDGGNHRTQQSRLGSCISGLCYRSGEVDTLSPDNPREVVGGLLLNPVEREPGVPLFLPSFR